MARAPRALEHWIPLRGQKLTRREPALDRIVKDQLRVADHGAEEVGRAGPASAVLIALAQVVAAAWHGTLLVPFELSQLPLGQTLHERLAARLDVCERHGHFVAHAARPTASPLQLRHELVRRGHDERPQRAPKRAMKQGHEVGKAAPHLTWQHARMAQASDDHTTTLGPWMPGAEDATTIVLTL
eukprot:890914-Pyramimonas_sp.AAC.1